MPRNVAMETLLGFVTAAGTTFTAVTIGTNQSLTIRDSGKEKPWPQIIDIFSNFQGTAGIARIRAASMPENQIGIYVRPTAAVRRPMLQDMGLPGQSGRRSRVAPNDTLDWMMQGSATGGDIDQLFTTVFYPATPTNPTLLLTADELSQLGVGVVYAENTITTGTDGQWATGERFDAEQNPFKANTYYAIAGYVNQTAVGAISYQVPTLGNLRVAGPGDTDSRITRNYFADLSRRSGFPTIPVFNSASLPSTIISAAVDENGADPIVNTFYVELPKDFNPDSIV